MKATAGDLRAVNGDPTLTLAQSERKDAPAPEGGREGIDPFRGYLLLEISVITILMTAYYAWRARTVAKRWCRAEAENDPGRHRA